MTVKPDETLDDTSLKDRLEALHPASYGWALVCCSRNPDEAADVLQGVYVKILSGRAEFNGKGHFKTWLFSVIRNTAIDAYRRNMVKTLGLKRLQHHQITSQAAGCNPAGTVEQDHRQQRITALLKKLPRRQRETLHLVFYQDLTLEETAEVLGISVGSVRTHYDRGKQKLRSLLTKHEEST